MPRCVFVLANFHNCDAILKRSETSGGETTADESPYAVINEGNGTNRKASLARIRPMSAPGLMSFEVCAFINVRQQSLPIIC